MFRNEYYICPVKSRRVVISILFLLVYSVGFAHQLIPHHNGDAGHKHFCEDSELSTFNKENLEENNCNELTCFVHDNHCDDGLYELLSCLFNDETHPEDDCKTEYFIPVKKSNSEIKKLSNSKVVAVIIALFIRIQ